MLGLGLKILGVDAHLFFVSSLSLIFDDPIDSGKKSVILSYPYIFAGMNSGPFLADQDVTRLDRLPAESFHAQSLSTAISAVARASSRFLVCHTCLLKIPIAKFQIPNVSESLGHCINKSFND